LVGFTTDGWMTARTVVVVVGAVVVDVEVGEVVGVVEVVVDDVGTVVVVVVDVDVVVGGGVTLCDAAWKLTGKYRSTASI